MRYRNARKRHNEDEVTRRSDSRLLQVVSVRDDRENRRAMIKYDDGNQYLHTEIM